MAVLAPLAVQPCGGRADRLGAGHEDVVAHLGGARRRPACRAWRDAAGEDASLASDKLGNVRFSGHCGVVVLGAGPRWGCPPGECPGGRAVRRPAGPTAPP